MTSKMNRTEFNEVIHASHDRVWDVLFHQYIECVEFEADGSLAPFAIRAGEWGDFLCGIYDACRRRRATRRRCRTGSDPTLRL